jgi:uncharacterized protein (TIGR02300 family)
VARIELGTKRICPETGKKFYDLNRDPVVSPYTGKRYPHAYFEEGAPAKPEPKSAPVKAPVAASEAEEDEEPAVGAPEFVSLEEADAGAEHDEEEGEADIPEIPDVEIEVEGDDDGDDDAFLDDEDEEEDFSNVIGGVDGEEEV